MTLRLRPPPTGRGIEIAPESANAQTHLGLALALQLSADDMEGARPLFELGGLSCNPAMEAEIEGSGVSKTNCT